MQRAPALELRTPDAAGSAPPSPTQRLAEVVARLVGSDPPVRRPVEYTPWVVGYVSATALVAAAIAAFTLRQPGDVATLVVLSLAIFLIGLFSVTQVNGVASAFTASAFIHLGLTLTLGVSGALSAAIAECAGVGLRHRSGWFRTVFNVSNYFLANWSALLLYRGITALPLPPLVSLILGGVAAGAAHYAVNYLVLSGLLGRVTRQGFIRQLRGSLLMSPYNIAYGYAAVGFVALHERYGPVGTSFALAPVVALQGFLVVLARRTALHETQRSQLIARIQEESVRVERSYDATLVALTHALDARDKETEGHSRRVVEYTRLIAVELGIGGDELKLLCHGALLHDIGKIGVPDRILHKPDKLTEEEWQIMRRHPEIGALMVEEVEYLAEARRIILHHHERWDGKGYPLGLHGTQITIGARAFAVADTLDAITQDRPYRRRRSFDEAREEILRHRGTQFDPDAVDAFMALREDELVGIAAIRARVGLDLLSGRGQRDDETWRQRRSA